MGSTVLAPTPDDAVPNRPSLPGDAATLVRPSVVTPRAIGIGFALLVLVVAVGFYAEIVLAATYQFASGMPAMAPLILLLLLTLANRRLGRFRLRPLTRAELLTIYGIVLVGGPVSARGIMIWLLATPMTFRYGVRTSPEWAYFLPNVATWFSPTDAAAVTGFFEGRSAVPWDVWIGPLLAWGSFMLALFTSTFCLLLLVRRQWITHERLSFPMAQVPLELVQGEGGSAPGRLPTHRLFRLGLLIAFALVTLTKLSQLFPALPAFSLSGPTLIDWQGIGPLAGLGAWELWAPPSLIGIAYLVPLDLSFSCWFFWLVRLGLTVLAIALGGTPQRPEEWVSSAFPAPVYQGGGAVLAVAVWALWGSRRHLVRALRSAWRGTPQPAEPIPYRAAVVALLLSSAYLVAFYVAAGARVPVGALFALLIVAHHFVWARLRAETGLGFIPFPLMVSSMVAVPFGTRVFLSREVTALMTTRWTYYPGYGESYEVAAGNGLDVLKIADSVGISSRRLVVAIGVGLMVAIAVGFYVTLRGIYGHGFINLPGTYWGWLQVMLRRNGSQIVDWTATPQGPDVGGLVAMVAGAAVTLVLGLLRGRFWWWPLHPVGYLAANCWGMHWFSQPFFLGWFAKLLLVRYGGSALYRKTVPLAIGLVLGDLVGNACWIALVGVLHALGMDV